MPELQIKNPNQIVKKYLDIQSVVTYIDFIT